MLNVMGRLKIMFFLTKKMKVITIYLYNTNDILDQEKFTK